MSQKIGIFGGTFDPVHWGHLLLAETARDRHHLHQIIWVPASTPPHKQGSATAFSHRLEMVRRAIDQHPDFLLYSNDGDRREHPSYAIDLLKELQTLHPGNQWYWILGIDVFQSLPRWYRGAELMHQCSWLVAPRPHPDTPETRASEERAFHQVCEEVAIATPSPPTLRWYPLALPPIGISASMIRQYCRDRRSIRYLVPESVRAYIEAHHLYQDPATF